VLLHWYYTNTGNIWVIHYVILFFLNVVLETIVQNTYVPPGKPISKVGLVQIRWYLFCPALPESIQ
jgi:hypothetical protein